MAKKDTGIRILSWIITLAVMGAVAWVWVKITMEIIDLIR